MTRTNQINHSPAIDDLMTMLDDDHLATARRVSEMPISKLARLHEHARVRRYVHHHYAVLEGLLAFALWRGHGANVNPFEDIEDTRVLEHARLLQAGTVAQVDSIFRNAWDRRNDGTLEYARLSGMALFEMHDAEE